MHQGKRTLVIKDGWGMNGWREGSVHAITWVSLLWDTRGCCRSFLASWRPWSQTDRQTGGEAEGLTSHLRKPSTPPPLHRSTQQLICNSISHNVISLAFTHLADKGKQACCLMKYSPKEQTHTQTHTHTHTHTRPINRKWMSFITRCITSYYSCTSCHTPLSVCLCVCVWSWCLSITERTGVVCVFVWIMQREALQRLPTCECARTHTHTHTHTRTHTHTHGDVGLILQQISFFKLWILFQIKFFSSCSENSTIHEIYFWREGFLFAVIGFQYPTLASVLIFAFWGGVILLISHSFIFYIFWKNCRYSNSCYSCVLDSSPAVNESIIKTRINKSEIMKVSFFFF